MIFRLFFDEFDLPINVLIWCFLSTLHPEIFFALYASTHEWGPIDV